MSRSWATGSTRRWRRLRAAILAANQMEHGGRCQLNVGNTCPRHGGRCLGVCTGQATEVHHVRGKAYGDDPKYLIPCCAACNKHVGLPGREPPPFTPASNW